ncbi:RNA polymerase II-associated protein [Fomitopsis serialis]|uniref:RNA polymerase II-associated protein n=1 Tax=Fomitopsis serialis TaxID=139415 RepID=UPI0020073DB3|nr:RNA polymerase II-associated protein [Neoantrodia serialis]KAH9932433.1 RNA polymerase II-associated protein [Neoantrodia serialis]
MNGDPARSPSPSAPGRTIDIELGQHEVITIELDKLDPDPSDLVELLTEGQCKVSIWTRLAVEYWRQGNLSAAEQIAQAGKKSLHANGAQASSAPLFSLLANIQMARAGSAPKLILYDAREDNMRTEKPREEYFRDAAQIFNQGERIATESGKLGSTLSMLTRGVMQMGTRALDDALRSFNSVLSQDPQGNNIIALLGKAKILYAQREHSQALKIFQTVLRLSPNCQPDPRIGIGLCLWAMDYKAKAKAAWQRSLEVNPNGGAASLLLGLEALNASKDETQTQEERKTTFLTGTRYIERAFKANQRNSAAANALCELILLKGQYKMALKLAERAIQFTDVKAILTDGYIRAGRVSHSMGNKADARKHYKLALKGQPANMLANIGLTQMQVKDDELAAAINTLDSFLQQAQSSRQRPVEAMVMLASLRANPIPGIGVTEKGKARELYDQVSKLLGLPDSLTHSTNGNHPHHTGRSSRRIAEDVDMHIEIARLWQDDNLERMQRALKEALRISEVTSKPNSKLVNNVAVLEYLDGNLGSARSMFENAIVQATTLDSATADDMSTTTLYNLARTYEEQGEESMAKDAYEKLLDRHPEYVDAKIRQAQMLADLNKHNEAHDLLKQALASEPNNLNLRAYYTYFLVQSNLPKPAKEFVFATLKDHDRHDLYSLCAAAWIQYYQARESRDPSPKGIEERKRSFQRAADFYQKALSKDSTLAVAAQGLAIIIAEDALGTLGGALGPPAHDEGMKRLQNAREALDVFAKVRESLNDGSVYINMGHCYYARDEFDRAIESYEAASRRYYSGQNVAVLLCLCRSYYAKATRDQSFAVMNTALQYAQKAYHLNPSDKAILYNIAMIQQKAAEMLLSIAPTKRSLKDLELAIQQATHAQKLFASLAADKSQVVPYSRDMADQRRKYGDSMLRRCDEHLATQRQHEAEAHAKLDAARQKRQQEREQQEALERARVEELKREAEQLAEERRKAREQALEWTRDIKLESDEERERKAAKKANRRVKTEVGSGDEGLAPEPRKKRRTGKLKKSAGGEDGEDAALFSGDEDEKPAKKRPSKKRVVRDDEDEDEPAGAPRKKQIKSREYISDSDEDMS